MLLDAAYIINTDNFDWRKSDAIADALHQPRPADLLAAFNDFFPKSILDEMSPEPSRTEAFRRIFEQRESMAANFKNEEMLQIIIEQSNVPVVIDAGIGAPSHAARAMELGADACLINTAIAIAGDPVQMAEAFALAIRAGRMAYTSGLGTVSHTAVATSPLTAFLD